MSMIVIAYEYIDIILFNILVSHLTFWLRLYHVFSSLSVICSHYVFSSSSLYRFFHSVISFHEFSSISHILCHKFVSSCIYLRPHVFSSLPLYHYVYF